jgi:hypothetical protein
MSNGPLFPLGPIPAVALAALSAGFVGMGGWAYVEGITDPAKIMAMIVAGGWPLAAALAVLVGPQLYRPAAARFGAQPWVAGIAGALTGFAPMLLFMGVAILRNVAAGDPVVVEDWRNLLVLSAVSGLVGGLVFWLARWGGPGK